MANRWMRRKLELELLEARVYLSAAASPDDPLRALRTEATSALVAQLVASNRISSIDVQTIESADARAAVVVLDVNGFADSGDALLATFDGATGELLGSLPVSGGQIFLVTQAYNTAGPLAVPVVRFEGTEINSSPQVSRVVTGFADQDGDLRFDQREFHVANLTDDPSGVGGDASSTVLSGNNFAVSQEDNFDNAIRPPRPVVPTDAAPVSVPVLVVFPSGRIPASFNVRAELNRAASSPAETNRDGGRPLILTPILQQWFGGLSASPWWTRATELPGVQSRVGDLLSRGLEDTYFGGKSRLASDDFLAGPSVGNVSTSSRVMLRSTANLMVFTSPRTSGSADQPGSELAIYSFATGQLTRTGYSVSGRLFRAGSQVAFLTAESEHGTDLSGDGVLNALVLQVFNPVTGGVRNTGIRAESIRTEAGQLILGVRDRAKQTPPAAADTVAGVVAAYRFDPATGQIVSLEKSFDAFSQRADAAASDATSELERIAVPDRAKVDRRESSNRLANEPMPTPVHTIAPIDTPASHSAHVATDAAARPTSGGPAGPPKPGGASGNGSDPAPSAPTSSSPAASAESDSSAGDAGAGGD